MISLTAVIRCKPGALDRVLEALVAVGAFVKAHEPDTLGYSVIRATDDPLVLITQDLFTDAESMRAHNEGEGSKAFFAVAKGLVDEVRIHVGERVFALGRHNAAR